MNTLILKKIYLLTALVTLPNLLFSQYQVNGNATALSCNCYQLTPNIGTQSGSVWNTNQISLNQAFDFTFEVFLGCNDAGADGIVFGLQPIGTGVGTSGGGMGLGGVSPSLGVYIDTYYNGIHFDPVADHLAINANGSTLHDGSADDLSGAYSLPFNIEDCAWHIFRVTWNPGTLTMQVYMDGTLYITYIGDIVANIFSGNPNVFWGMTAATGGATNTQQFCTQLNTEWATALADYTCVGQPMEFSDSTSSFGQVVNWNWNFGDGNTSSLQDPSHVYAADGNYNVMLTVTDASGCADSVTHVVTVASPSLNPTANPTAVCPGFDAQLNAGLTHPFSSEYDFTWTPAATLNNPSISNPIATPTATTMYSVTALDPVTGCSVTDSVLLTLTPPPDFDPILNVAVCANFVFPALQGSFLTANAAYFTGAAGSGTQYNPGDSYNVVGSTTFYAFDDNSGCSDETSFVVTIVPLPTVDLGADVSICTFEETVLNATSAGATYNWSNGATSSAITTSSAGTYWVEVTENGCVNSDTVQVSLLPLPIVSLGADTVICDYSFDISPSALFAAYNWQDGSSNAAFTVIEPGTYTVTVTDGFGCVGNGSIYVGNGCQPEILVPNVFTPNDDGINDFFYTNASSIIKYNMVIVNRWGEVMREFDLVTDQWDGTTKNGNDAIAGVYFWKIVYSYLEDTLEVTKELSGNVTLIRD